MVKRLPKMESKHVDIEAILKLPSPQTKKDAELLLGMLTYLSKFIPNMRSLTEPLRVLLKQELHWH